MTYRDDHDAAIERADALAAELARTKAERDAVTSERDRLAAELATAPPASLTASEREQLLASIERGRANQHGQMWILVLGGVLFVALAIVAFVEHRLVQGAACLIGGLLAIAYGKPRTTRSDARNPVIVSLRDAPASVTEVLLPAHYPWYTAIKTETGTLELPLDPAAATLLKRYCPNARFRSR